MHKIFESVVYWSKSNSITSKRFGVYLARNRKKKKKSEAAKSLPSKSMEMDGKIAIMYSKAIRPYLLVSPYFWPSSSHRPDSELFARESFMFIQNAIPPLIPGLCKQYKQKRHEQEDN